MKKIGVLCFVLIAFSAAVVFGAGAREADDRLWPRTQPVVTVGFGAGGGTDTAVRPIIAEMEEYLGETINVVNMEGASSAVAAQHVLNRPADGYSMYATGSGPFSGFRVVGTVDTDWTDWVSWHPFSGPGALIVRTDSPFETIEDVLGAIDRDEVNFGISGFGVGPHVLIEAVLGIAGTSSPNYVTGGSCRNAAVAVIAGDVHAAMVTFSAAVDFVRSGDLRAIFVTTPESYMVGNVEVPSVVDVLPGSDNVPLLSETWPFMMRRDAPAGHIEKLTEAFIWAMQQPSIVEYAESQALEVVAYHGEDADQFLSFSEAGYSWTLWNAGLGEKNPATFNIPTMDEWSWDVEKSAVY